MPRGRPAAPTTIVPVMEIMNAQQILDEKHNITLLSRAMPDARDIMKWCDRRCLLKNSMVCNVSSSGHHELSSRAISMSLFGGTLLRIKIDLFNISC